MPQPLVHLSEVSVRRGMKMVLNSISLSVYSGEVHLLKGRNGSGKSTLIETMVGLSPLETGKVEHRGHLLIDAEGRRKRSPLSVGVTLQSDGVLGSETVDEHIRTSVGMYGRDIEFEPFLKEFQLLHRQHDMVSTLSAGQRRKVAILSSLLPAFSSTDATCVVLDEPDAGLDENSINVLSRWCRQLNTKGHAIVLSTHQSCFDELATHTHLFEETLTTTTQEHDVEGTHPEIKGRDSPTITSTRFGLQQQFRTMSWLHHNVLAGILSLGVMMAILTLPLEPEEMETVGFILIPAMAAGLCGDALVSMLREERSLQWWKATAHSIPHSSWLPFAFGGLLTSLSSATLSGFDGISGELILAGTLICGCVAHLMRMIQIQVERLARPHAVFIGLLTPVLILPFAVIVDMLSK